MKLIAPLTALCCAVALSACTTTGDSTSGEPVDTSLSSLKTTRAAEKAKSPFTPYPYDYCAVIRTPFSQRPVKHRRIYEGQEVLFCCTPCVRSFDANPEPFMPHIRAGAGN